MRLLEHKTFPVWIFGVGLLAFVFAAFQLAYMNHALVAERFDTRSASVANAVKNKISTQLTLLRGTAGLFNASENVTASQFQAYVDRLGLETNYPGVLGIGFAVTARRRAEIDRLADGLDPLRDLELEAWPVGDRPGYSTILFLEPRNERNLEAIGFDMMSEETRRTAMEMAAQTGLTTVSGRVQLVQEIDPEKQPGFLVYTPLFEDAESQRRHEPYGWVYSPLRAYDLFETVFPPGDRRDISISVFDGAATQENLLFRSNAQPENSTLRSLQTIEVGGRQWTVEIIALPTFAGEINYLLPWLIGAVGVVLSLLLALLSWQQARAATQVESQVKLRTDELQATNTKLRNEVEAREKAESTVRQMQKIESVGQLTGGIAHDFNNMLAIIIGNLDMARRWISDPTKLEKRIEQARLGADRAAALTQRLLAFSRQQPLNPDRVDANVLLRNMDELLDRTIGKRIDVRTELDDDLWPALADASQLENAVLNLAINARDAMQDGDTLTIKTFNAHRDRIDVQSALVSGEYVAIAVCDTGSGMSNEVRAKAFDPFYTTKEVGKGTGLGLSQVFGFARQSGGDLTIESVEDEGTTITIYLPKCASKKLVGQNSTAQNSAATVEGGKAQELILVVDDEEQVRTITVEILRELGYSVVDASSGLDALQKLRVNPGIRLVLSDIMMPEMNGHQLAEHALSAVPDLKFAFVTGYDSMAETSDITEKHKIARLQKPFTQDALAKLIRKTLDQGQYADIDQDELVNLPTAANL